MGMSFDEWIVAAIGMLTLATSMAGVARSVIATGARRRLVYLPVNRNLAR